MSIASPYTITRQDIELLRRFRAKPSDWVKAHIDIKLAKYRSEDQFLQWLSEQPEGTHQWARTQYKMGKLTLDSRRSYQAEALDKMAKPGRYAIQWANAIGKTGTAALLVLWFLDCYPGAKVVTTAGTWSQLKEQLWREIPYWASKTKSPIVVEPQNILKTQIELGDKRDWMAFGRAATNEKTFEGIHGRYVMILMDESKAIRPNVFNAARRILRGADGKFWWICLGSPGSPSGPFWDITNGDQAQYWDVLKMSAYESTRIGLDQVTMDHSELGGDSPLFISMDCGEFPDVSEDAIIPLSWVQAAIDREVSLDGPLSLGIDVARFGSDETVFMEMVNRLAQMRETYVGKSLPETTGRLVRWHDEYDKIAVDDEGLGGGVTDFAREKGVMLHTFRAGLAAENKQDFFNLGAEAMWSLRDAFRLGFENYDDVDVGVSIPNDKRLISQLSARLYRYMGDGRIRIESKDEMRKRGVKSPDRAEGLMMAWWARSRHSGEAIAVSSDQFETTSVQGGNPYHASRGGRFRNYRKAA